MRAESGGEVRPLRPLPGLPGLSGLRLYHAAGGGDAGPLSQVRRAADEAHRHQQEDQQAVHLLLLRAHHGPGGVAQVRLHDLGCAGEGRLSGVRAHHVQEGGPGLQAALLHQRDVSQLPAGGQTGLS